MTLVDYEKIKCKRLRKYYITVFGTKSLYAVECIKRNGDIFSIENPNCLVCKRNKNG